MTKPLIKRVQKDDDLYYVKVTKAQNYNEIDEPKEVDNQFFGKIEGFEVDDEGKIRSTVPNLDEILQARRLDGDFVILLEGEKGPVGVLSYTVSDIDKMAEYAGLADASLDEKEDNAYNLAEDLASQYEEYFAFKCESYSFEILDTDDNVLFSSNAYPSVEEALLDADGVIKNQNFHKVPSI